jgi:hypothetical protein
MDTTQNNGQEDGDLSQEPYPSPRFFIEPGEQVQREALNIGLKNSSSMPISPTGGSFSSMLSKRRSRRLQRRPARLP